ncbi:hypothetical protein [Jiella mangrovi]|nr:hypothetical protein [Jiella mangrovi]
MRKFIISAAVALAATLSAGAAAQAANTKVIIVDKDAARTHASEKHHGQVIVEKHNGSVVVKKSATKHVGKTQSHKKDCRTKKVVKIQHGKKVVEKTRVCH